jgi:subtilisin family serine protease
MADKVYGHAIRGFAARLSPDQVRKLKNDSRVDSVEPDRIITAFPQTPPTGVRRIATDQNAIAAVNGVDANGGLGLDTDIAIIDTGIQPDHPDLRVAGGASFIWNGSTCAGGSYADDNGHGTHVAGTAAARDNGIGVAGVAPGARLWAVKVLDNTGSGSTSCVIAGVDWVTANAATIKVANMSMGGGSSPALCNAIANSVAAGVIYAVAAGNSGADASGTSPANCSSVIAVSAIADYNGLPGGGYSGSDCYGYNPPYYGPDDTFARFSSYGSVVDIAAPGVCITSTYLGGGYRSMSGTSMASPHAAGAAALFRLAGYRGSADGPTVVSAMTAAGYTTPQNGPCGFTGDRDAFREPVVWLGAPCGATPTPAPTASPTPAPAPTASPTPAPAPTESPTPAPAPTASPTPAPTPTPEPTCAAPTITSHSDTKPTGGGTVSFTWAPVPGAITYRVQRQGNNGSWSTRKTSSATSFTGSDPSSDPFWRVFVYTGTCAPIPGPATVFDP